MKFFALIRLQSVVIALVLLWRNVKVPLDDLEEKELKLV